MPAAWLRALALSPAISQAAGPPVLSVFGHKVPDTDTTISAIAYAWELVQRNIPAKAYLLGELNPETVFVLKTLGLPAPPLLKEPLAKKEPVAIVDTNNPAELPEGIEKAAIHSIVDHHKLSGLENAEPLEVDMRPLCSAGSILYARAKAAGLTPPKHIAGLMLAGLLSDSLEFRSPTTTEIDRVYAKELGELAGLDVHEFAEGMLEAKAQIDHLSPKELVMMDTKIFKIGGQKLRVSVLETTKPAMPLKKKAEMVAAQLDQIKEETLDDMLLFVVDIIKEEATFVSCRPSAAKIVEKAWKATLAEDGTILLPGVLSRKKQMIPALEAAAAKEL
jgi:manganese-dependent inorganic pyrophosphatase